jgi:hypothetical protein
MNSENTPNENNAFSKTINNLIGNSTSTIYRLGIISILCILIIYSIEAIVVIIYGIFPDSFEDIIKLYKENKTIWYLQAFTPDFIAVFFKIPMFIALFISLINIKKSFLYLLIATICAFLYVAIYYSSNTVFSMVYLINQYTSSINEEQRNQILAAGRGVLSIYNGSGSMMAFNLAGIAGIIISIIMIKSPSYSKLIGWIGIIGNTLGYLGLPPGLGPEFYFKYLFSYQILIGGVFLIIWEILLVLKLRKLLEANI